MKTSLTSTAPWWPLEQITSTGAHWEQQLKTYIAQHKVIAFDRSDLEQILRFEAELTEAGYEHRILSSNCQRHFLVPGGR